MPIVPHVVILLVPAQVESLVFSTSGRPTLAAVVPALIVAVESWLAVAPAAAPDLTVATAVPSTLPVKLPASIVAVELLSTLPKPTADLLGVAASQSPVPAAE